MKRQSYTDDYTANLMRVIKARSKGTTSASKTDERPVVAHVVSVMDRLKEIWRRQAGTKRTTAVKRPPSSKASRKNRERAA